MAQTQQYASVAQIYRTEFPCILPKDVQALPKTTQFAVNP
jgi:hypothetical protein